MDISNQDELNKVMMDICEKAINQVSEYILEDLKEIILRDTYNSHGPNSVYIPSMEFLSSFEWDSIIKTTNNITRKLFYNWQSMHTDENKYVHISYPEKNDTREILASLLNIYGTDPNNPWSVNREPFWDNALNDLFDKGKIDHYFLQVLSDFGVYPS